MGLLQKAQAHFQENLSDVKVADEPKKKLAKPEDEQYAYQKVLQILQEIFLAQSEEKIYRMISLALTGFFGPVALAFFKLRNQQFVHSYSEGFYFSQKDVYPTGKLPEILVEKPIIHYVEKILDKLSQEERYFCEPLRQAFVIPAMVYGKLKGFLFLKINRTIFQGEEQLFLQIFASTLGIVFQLSDFIYGIEKQRKENEHRKERQALFNEVIFSISRSQSNDDIQRILKNTLLQEFGITRYIIYLISDDYYKPLLSAGFSQSHSFLDISIREPRIQEIAALGGWKNLPLSTWRSFLEGYFRLNVDELTSDWEILPIYQKGLLLGFFILLAVDKKLPGDDRFFLQGILQFSLFALAATEEPPGIIEILRDKLSLYEQTLQEGKKKYAAIQIQIANLSRLEALFGTQKVLHIRQKAKEIIQKYLHADDFLTEYLPGHYFFFAQNWDFEETVLLVHKIQTEINQLHPKEEVAPLVRTKFFCRPKDPIPEITHFLQN